MLLSCSRLVNLAAVRQAGRVAFLKLPVWSTKGHSCRLPEIANAASMIKMRWGYIIFEMKHCAILLFLTYLALKPTESLLNIWHTSPNEWLEILLSLKLLCHSKPQQKNQTTIFDYGALVHEQRNLCRSEWWKPLTCKYRDM